MTVVLTAALLLPMTNHTQTEFDQWQSDWLDRVEAEGWVLSMDLSHEWADMHARHPEIFDTGTVAVLPAREAVAPPPVAPPPAPQSFAPGVEYWRPLIMAYFKPENVDAALSVLGCETGYTGDPNSYNSLYGAAGLFQFIPGTWNRVAVPLGYGDYSSGAVYDPTANVHAASVLSNGGSNWSQWSCKP